jgi:transposase-like protein
MEPPIVTQPKTAAVAAGATHRRPVRRRGALIDPTWLRRRYLEDRAPVATIAAEAGVAEPTVYKAIAAAGIPHRGKAGSRPHVILTHAWLAAQVQAGRVPQAIADQIGVKRDAVVWQLAKHQLLDVSSEPRAARAAELYGGGDSLAQVSAKVGVGRKTVTIWLMALGVKIRRRGRRSSATHAPGADKPQREGE